MIDAVMDTRARHEATDEELRAAWQKCRASNWPASFEETMQDPLRSRLVHTVAAGLARKRQPPTASTFDVPACRVHGCACEDVRPSRRCANCVFRPPLRPSAPPPGFIDRKRLAAGDRDDD